MWFRQDPAALVRPTRSRAHKPQAAHSTCFGARREMPVGAEERVRLELPLRGRAVTCRLVEAKATIDVLPAIRDTYVDSPQLAPTPKDTLLAT